MPPASVCLSAQLTVSLRKISLLLKQSTSTGARPGSAASRAGEDTRGVYLASARSPMSRRGSGRPGAVRKVDMV